MSPTQRSLKQLRDAGFIARVVEHWNPHAKIRQDLWGADILAFWPFLWSALAYPELRNRPVLVQTTTASNASKRLAKVLAMPEAAAWVRSGNGYVIHSWALRGARGTRKVWTCVADWLTVDRFTVIER